MIQVFHLEYAPSRNLKPPGTFYIVWGGGRLNRSSQRRWVCLAGVALGLWLCRCRIESFLNGWTPFISSDGETMSANQSLVFSDGTCDELADGIAKALGLRRGGMVCDRFRDGEFRVVVSEDVAGATCLLVQALTPSNTDSLFRAGLIADALRRNGAQDVMGIFPYLPGARQNKAARGEPLSAWVVAAYLEKVARFDTIITADVHALSLDGFYVHTRLINVSPARGFAQALRAHGFTDSASIVVVAPDGGAVTRADALATELGCSLVAMSKCRRPSGEIIMLGVPDRSEIANKCCVLCDDIVATAGTMSSGAQRLRSAGASEILAVASHVTLPAIFEQVSDGTLDRLFVSNSLPLPDPLPERVVVIDLAPVLAEAIAGLLA